MESKIYKMVWAAAVAAIYTALSTVLAPISFGAVQLRAAEAMTILPVFNSSAIWGLGLGCAITNFIGMTTGANLLGAVDIVAGTAATVLAALLTRALRGREDRGLPVLATLPPVFVNAVVVGAELAVVVGGEALFSPGFWAVFFGFAASVAGGQLAACTALGLLLYSALNKTGAGVRLRRL
jgi:uncharacterized membrane protein